MAGGDLMEQETRHTSLLSKSRYGGDFIQLPLSNGYTSDTSAQHTSREIRHLNSAIYVESFCDDNQSTETDYHLDLTNCNDSVTFRPDIVTNNIHIPRSPSCAEVRYINPAIFIQKIESNENSSGEEDLTQSRKYYYPNSECSDVGKCERTFERGGSSSTLIIKKRNEQLSMRSTYQQNFIACELDTSRSRGLSFDEWLAVKQGKDKLQKKTAGDKTKDVDGIQKQQRLEKQREDFKVWLARKKELEKQKKEQEESQLQKLKFEKELKAKRASERDSAFKAWVKRKEDIAKEKKKKEDMVVQRREQERRQRQEKSTRAFDEWIEKSKYNPRPVPLNMGVESLRGSVSSMFINPTPWQENIEQRRPAT